jgi:extradiol dioxygenase
MIQSLSYIGFTSPNADAWLEFGPSILGMEAAPTGPDGTVRLRVDDAVHRIAIHRGKTDDLAYLGWEVAGPAALESAAAAIEREGIQLHRGEPQLISERAVADLAWFIDPFGFRHELSWGLTTRPSSFRPGRPHSGFVTGCGGLGHAVLFTPDLDLAEQFYSKVLGFRLSDRIEAGISLRFFHCNRRHHTIAFGSVPGMVGFHHLMLETASLDDVGIALDLCNQHNIPLTMSLGRHTNDLMTSFYVRTPSGFEIEYGWGGRVIESEENWTVRTYDATSIWGHKHPEKAPRPGILRPFKPYATNR